MEEELKKRFNLYYQNAKAINKNLLKKSENIYCEDIELPNAIYFHMSSLMISLLINYFDGREKAMSNYLCARSIIEDVATMLYYETELVDEGKKKFLTLFRCTHFILEYRIYSKFQRFMKETCNINEMTENYQKALETYSRELSITKSDVEKKYFDKVLPPFFNLPKSSYSKIVSKVFNNTEDKTYKALSLLSHPHSYGSEEIFGKDFIEKFIDLVCKSFFSKNQDLPDMNYFLEKDFIVNNNDYIIRLNELYLKQENVVVSIIDYFDKKGIENIVSYSLNNALDFLEELKINGYLGYTELGKIKFRLILETFASFSFIYFDSASHGDDRYQTLFYDYSQYLFYSSQNYNSRCNDKIAEIVDHAYSHYCDKINKTFPKENYSAQFKSSLGWSVNENGKKMSLTKMVSDYIDKTIPDKPYRLSNLREMAHVFYEESEIMVHANGYLYSANSETCGDIDNCAEMLDQMIGRLIGLIYKCYYVWSIVDNNNKEFADFLYSAKKNYSQVVTEKIEYIAKMPNKINKPGLF